MLMFSSCSDFFNPSTDDALDGKDYISSNTEMYTGFLGIMTKLQAVGDKEILLTETRGELLEPTATSTPDLVALYNYNSDLTGNPYANPAAYYELIIACNDYLNKIKVYAAKPGVDQEIYQNLVASTVRVKVWAYKTIGEIYGKAVWFDDAVVNVDEFLKNGNYETLDMPALVDRCLALMDNGFDGISTQRTIDWIAWLDPENVTNIASSSYRKWNYMIPTYEGIYSELCLWKGAILDSQNQDAASYYKKTADVLLNALSTYIDDEGHSGNNPYWMPNAGTAGRYQNLWYAQDPYAPENVTALIYDYKNNQTNSIVRHFCSDYPAEYLLRPTESGRQNFLSSKVNPGGTTNETRYKNIFRPYNDGYYMGKFRQNNGYNGIRTNAYEADVQIYLYRATQYHILLCEALNHLQRFTALGCVLNGGINNFSAEIIDSSNVKEWEGFSRNWTADAEWGTRKYYCEGIRGAFSLTPRTITTIYDASLAEALRANDEQILNEYMMEFACEGKVYPAMNRMALRYNDLNIVANRVCPKYKETGMESEIRAKILAGGNYMPYNLGVTK